MPLSLVSAKASTITEKVYQIFFPFRCTDIGKPTFRRSPLINQVGKLSGFGASAVII